MRRRYHDPASWSFQGLIWREGTAFVRGLRTRGMKTWVVVCCVSGVVTVGVVSGVVTMVGVVGIVVVVVVGGIGFTTTSGVGVKSRRVMSPANEFQA
jgi:hypothetical protein